jgi:hypothetical protein
MTAPAYRASSDLDMEMGLDSFATEENETGIGSGDTGSVQRAPSRETVPANPAAPAQTPRPPRPRANVLSMASRAISHARESVSGRTGIATVVPRLVQNARLDKIVPAAQSLSTTLTKPRWRFEARLVIPLVLAAIGFSELWWVSHRLSNPAQSLADSASLTPAPPVVAESSEEVKSVDSKGNDVLRMRVTFRSVTPAGTNPKTKDPTWVAIAAPMPVEVIERGQQIGTSWSGGMKLSPGPHELRIVNRSMGIDVQKSVDVVGGGMASLSLDFPPGTLQMNVVPWANVTLDGVSIGKTPLDKIELSPGRHDLVFTHPKLGQRRASVTIKSGKPQRLIIDMKRRGR